MVQISDLSETEQFASFWEAIKAMLLEEFDNRDIPPLAIVLPTTSQGTVKRQLFAIDLRPYYHTNLGERGKMMAMDLVRSLLSEDDVSMVACVNEAWMLMRSADSPPLEPGYSISSHPDRVEQLVVVISSKTRQTFSLSPINRAAGRRTVAFQDPVFNNENGQMLSGLFDIHQGSLH